MGLKLFGLWFISWVVSLVRFRFGSPVGPNWDRTAGVRGVASRRVRGVTQTAQNEPRLIRYPGVSSW